jgi:hypothetical protein
LSEAPEGASLALLGAELLGGAANLEACGKTFSPRWGLHHMRISSGEVLTSSSLDDVSSEPAAKLE